MRVKLRTVAIPRSGREREGVISTTSLSTCSVSPGRVGFGQASSPPAPMIPPVSGNPLSTNRRMVIAAVCQPLATKPANSVALAAVLILMERLGIELSGKGFDLRLVDDVRSTGEALAHKEIVEIEPLV